MTNNNNNSAYLRPSNVSYGQYVSTDKMGRVTETLTDEVRSMLRIACESHARHMREGLPNGSRSWVIADAYDALSELLRNSRTVTTESYCPSACSDVEQIDRAIFGYLRQQNLPLNLPEWYESAERWYLHIGGESFRVIIDGIGGKLSQVVEVDGTWVWDHMCTFEGGSVSDILRKANDAVEALLHNS